MSTHGRWRRGSCAGQTFSSGQLWVDALSQRPSGDRGDGKEKQEERIKNRGGRKEGNGVVAHLRDAREKIIVRNYVAALRLRVRNKLQAGLTIYSFHSILLNQKYLYSQVESNNVQME